MLTEEQKTTALTFLNEVAPDTYNEGEFGPWSFTALRCEGTEYTLEFTNSEGADEVTFELAGAAFDESGGVTTEFLDTIRSAVFAWEEENTAY